MKYVLTNCVLPENLLTGASHKRFGTLIRKAANAGIGWSYSFHERKLEITNAPEGLTSALSKYGTVEVLPDA